MKNHKGFTLIEALLVLMVVMIMVAFLPPLYFSLLEKMETNHFMQQLEEDLLYAHQYAISNQTDVNFLVRDIHQNYEIKTDRKLIIRRSIPDGIKIVHGNMSNFFFFRNGNINKFGKMQIKTPQKDYYINFSIGRGQFTVNESE